MLMKSSSSAKGTHVSDFELVQYRDDEKEGWDQVVKSSHNGTFLHLRNYIGYHVDRFDEQSLIVRKQGRSIAVFPANRIDDLIVSHSGITYGGLIYGPRIRSVEVLEIIRAIADHYRNMGCALLRYKAIPHVFHRYPAEEDLYALFRLGARLVRAGAAVPLRLHVRTDRRCRQGFRVRGRPDRRSFQGPRPPAGWTGRFPRREAGPAAVSSRGRRSARSRGRRPAGPAGGGWRAGCPGRCRTLRPGRPGPAAQAAPAWPVPAPSSSPSSRQPRR